mgnify:CR=1 FL=1
MKSVILQSVLWILAIFFSYQIYDSINGPINFNKTKNIRYTKVINRLKEIRKAQIAHKDVNGIYANNFDSLVKFIDEGIFIGINNKGALLLKVNKEIKEYAFGEISIEGIY